MHDENDNMILCPSCGVLCSEDAQFCKACRSPITSYASTGPYESVFAEGAAYRSALNEPTKLIVVIGVWMIFGPLVPCGLVILSNAILQQREFTSSDIYSIILGAVFLLLGGYILFKTTRNYLKHKKSA